MNQSCSKWITWDMFKRLGDKCSLCDKTAKWLPFDGTWNCYCDDHHPGLQEKQKEEGELSK